MVPDVVVRLSARLPPRVAAHGSEMLRPEIAKDLPTVVVSAPGTVQTGFGVPLVTGGVVTGGVVTGGVVTGGVVTGGGVVTPPVVPLVPLGTISTMTG